MSESERPSELGSLRPMTAHNNLHGVLFNAKSAEYFALAIQCYQLARHALMERLSEGTYLNPAVVMDLDETVLDNSPYQAWLIASGHNYHEDTNWSPWCDEGQADAVPGAVEFVRFARAQGVEVIFITSRVDATRRGTAANLRLLDLITDDEFEVEQKDGGTAGHAHYTRLFMKGMPATEVVRPSGSARFVLDTKFQHRRFCEEVRRYEVILSIGDNLSDWAEYYGNVVDMKGKPIEGANPTVEERRRSAEQDSKLFGRDFVLLPNPTYGGWLRAYERHQQGASDELPYVGDQIRGAIEEPQEEFHYPGGSKKATAPKFSAANLRIWPGPKGG